MTEYALAQDSGFKLGSEGSIFTFTPLSLLDMLKRYSFGFYEVITSLEKLRNTAGIYTYGSYSSKKLVDVIDRAKSTP